MISACWPLLLTATATPAPADAAPKALEGRWVFEAVLYQRDIFGAGPETPLTPTAFEVKRDRLTIRLSGLKSADAELTTDEAATPKCFDARLSNGHVFRGIFALDGDVLVVCVQMESERKRPTAFSTLSDDRTVLFILRRQR